MAVPCDDEAGDIGEDAFHEDGYATGVSAPGSGESYVYMYTYMV